MSQDDPGLELYEILAEQQRRGQPLLGQAPHGTSASRAAPRIAGRSPVAPLEKPIRRLTGPMSVYSPGSKAAVRNVAAAPPSARPMAAPGGAEAPPAAEAASEAPWAVRARRALTEIVIDVNTAFLIFAVMAALMCVAFVLGHRRGWEESTRLRLASSESFRPAEDGLRMRSAAAPDPDALVLWLNVYNDDPDAGDRRTPEQLESIAAEVRRELRKEAGTHFDVALFLDEARRVRHLAVTGDFHGKDDPRLSELTAFFHSYPGPRIERETRPYANCAILSAASLGRFVPP